MSNLIENPILDQHGSKPHGMRSLSPGDISPIDAITGRQKIDPRLGALAVPFLIAWGVACGEAAGGRGGTEPSTPTPIVEPTKTPVPDITAIAEAKKPTATPEKQLTKEEAVAAVNQIISLIQNPDPALVSKLDLDLVRLDEDQKRLIYGFFGKAGSETNYAPDSLYGLQALIREGKIEEAKKLLRKPLINYLTNPVLSKNIEARNDRGGWNEQQLEKYDPRELLYSWRKWEIKDLGISRIKEKALLRAVNLYYGL